MSRSRTDNEVGSAIPGGMSVGDRENVHMECCKEIEGAVDVSVVIPCLDEEKTIGGCIRAAWEGISRAGLRGEVIVSDNGSVDRSREIARELRARVVQCEYRGYGNALRVGFAACRGRWILMGDADQSYDFSELPLFAAKIAEGYDLVMGDRLGGKIEPGAMPWMHRHVGNPVLSAILRLFFGSNVRDTHCGMRAFTRDTVARMDLRTSGMELASEMITKAVALRLRVANVPITLYRDKRDRPPHLRTFRDGWRHLRYMLMMAPDWLFIRPGALMTLVGGGVLLILTPGPFRIGNVRLDVHTMLLGMSLVILGVNLLVTGLYVKVFAYTEGFSSLDKGFTRALSRLQLEHGLAIAAMFIVTGFLGDLRFLLHWRATGFGDLNVMSGMRVAILYTTLLLVGVEVFFASFFLSMLGIDRETYRMKHE